MPRSPIAAPDDFQANFSIEVTIRDPEALEAARRLLPPGSEVFIADLPDQDPGLLVKAATRFRHAGFRPVPHMVARNIGSEARFADLLARLVNEAEVERVFLLGGDREQPAGPFREALQLLETGLLQRHGIGELALACFPEGHPTIAREALERALDDKLRAARHAGLPVLLVSQFVFEATPLLAYAAKLREGGVSAPIRVGVAGPADRETLLKFGRELGAGPSIASLAGSPDVPDRESDIRTPRELLSAIGGARKADPGLRIEGVHYFAFGSTADTIAWAEAQRAPRRP